VDRGANGYMWVEVAPNYDTFGAVQARSSGLVRNLALSSIVAVVGNRPRDTFLIPPYRDKDEQLHCLDKGIELPYAPEFAAVILRSASPSSPKCGADYRILTARYWTSPCV